MTFSKSESLKPVKFHKCYYEPLGYPAKTWEWEFLRHYGKFLCYRILNTHSRPTSALFWLWGFGIMFNFSGTYVPRWGIIPIELTIKCYCNKDKLTHIGPCCPCKTFLTCVDASRVGRRKAFLCRGHCAAAQLPSHSVCVRLQSAAADRQTDWPTVDSQSWEVLKNSVNPRSNGTYHDPTDERYHMRSAHRILIVTGLWER